MSRISAIPSPEAEPAAQDRAPVETRQSKPKRNLRFISTALAIGAIGAIGFMSVRFALWPFAEDAKKLAPPQMATSPLDPASLLKDDLAKQLTRTDELGRRVDTNSSRIDVAEKSLASITEKLTTISETVQELGGKVSALSAAKPAVHRAVTPKPKAPSAPSPARVLGVDTWNGEPVVAVEAGGVIEFIRPGDQTGTSVLRSADPATQRAEFTRAPVGGESR